MDGVGARLGRSSTRYGGPATVFTGPVRRWKKKWVPLSNPNPNNPNNNNNNTINNSNNSTHLLVYKWTPVSKDSDEPPRKKYRYVPIAVIEEQKQEEAVAAAEKSEEEKADVNGVKEEEDQALDMEGTPAEDASETSLDLNMGLKARDGDSGNDPKMGEQEDNTDQLEREPFR